MEAKGLEQIPGAAIQPGGVGIASNKTHFCANGSAVQWVGYLCVSFNPFYRGVEIRGRASEIGVLIGGDGEVLGFVGAIWRLRESGRKVQVKPPEEALAEWSELFSFRGSQPIVIESMELVYYAEDGRGEILPCYIVYIVRGHDPNGIPATRYLKAT